MHLIHLAFQNSMEVCMLYCIRRMMIWKTALFDVLLIIKQPLMWSNFTGSLKHLSTSQSSIIVYLVKHLIILYGSLYFKCASYLRRQCFIQIWDICVESWSVSYSHVDNGLIYWCLLVTCRDNVDNGLEGAHSPCSFRSVAFIRCNGGALHYEWRTTLGRWGWCRLFIPVSFEATSQQRDFTPEGWGLYYSKV